MNTFSSVETQKEWTADEFFHSPLSQNHEIVEGELIKTMPAGFIRGVIALRAGRLIGNFVEEYNLGEVVAAETGFILGKKSFRGADAAFISTENLQKYGYPQSFFPVAPDLAVEVASPGNSSEELMEKVNLYLQGGSKMVWIFYPKTKIVTVFRLNNVISLLRENETLDGEDVLPNFRLPLSKVFGNLPSEKE